MKSIVRVQAVQLIPPQGVPAPGQPPSQFGPAEETVMVQLVGDINISFRTGKDSAPMVGDNFEVQINKMVTLGEEVKL